MIKALENPGAFCALLINTEPYIVEGKGGCPLSRGLRYGQCKAAQGNLHIF